MIELELTDKIKAWLDTEPTQRSLSDGADLLLRVTRNRILYTNITRNLNRHTETIEYHLQKVYKQRIIDITHAEVSDMVAQVATIAKTRGLTTVSSSKRSELQRGKRADHEQLPPEVQQLYVDNADILRRMRECHTRLRMITPDNSTCPDSDRYPWAKEIISLDKKYRDNWNLYDHYVKGETLADIKPAKESRTESANAARVCNMLLGRYASKPSDELAARIKQSYSNILSPSASLQTKMAKAGLL